MELSCTFTNANWKNPTATVYACRITSAKITKPGTLVKTINGVHQAGKTNEDVVAVNFRKTTVEHFPKGLEKIFPNLTRFQIYKCGLKEISRRDFVGLERVIGFYLHNNKIELLPDNLFVGMKNLQYISFDVNKISFASSKLLKPIEKQLKGAWFSGNHKIDVDCENLTPATLTDLKQRLDKCDKPKLKLKAVASSGVDPRELFGPYGEKLELMWKTGKYSDFTILVDKKEFKVHKCILGNHSSFFETMFDQEMEESLTGKMTIDVFKPEPVEEFLKFFYTGETPSTANAIEVFKISAMYEVPKLTDLCEDMIIENIDESNVVDILQLAKVHERDEMKSCAVEVFKSMVPSRKLKDSLFDDCEAMKRTIEAQKAYDLVLNPFSME